MDKADIPNSPHLPEQEVESVPTSTIPPQLAAGLDLDDDIDETDIAEAVASHPKPIENFDQFEHSDSLPSTPSNNVLSSSIPKDENYVTPLMDFSDPVKAPKKMINPFGNNETLSSSDPIPILLEPRLNVRRLSDTQEQKLGEYIDDRLMSIQRGFVKYMSSKEENTQEGLQWGQLVYNVDEILEFIWYAMTQVRGIPTVYHANVLSDVGLRSLLGENFNEIEQSIKNVVRIPQGSSLFGWSGVDHIEMPHNLSQSMHLSFLLRIMSDIIDYIAKYEFLTLGDWILLLRMLAKIDNTMSTIIDYSNLKPVAIISTTEKVRIASLVQRTKLAIVELFDLFVQKLGVDEVHKHRHVIDAFQIFVGEAYEGLVDRTSM